MHVARGLHTRCGDNNQEDWIKIKDHWFYFLLGESEVMLRKWMMGRDTLGYSGRIGSMNLEELASGDYPTFSALI